MDNQIMLVKENVIDTKKAQTNMENGESPKKVSGEK